LTPEEYNVKLGAILPEKSIVQMLGWKRTYLNAAKNVSCCMIKKEA
jgi:hypothetical protein